MASFSALGAPGLTATRIIRVVESTILQNRDRHFPRCRAAGACEYGLAGGPNAQTALGTTAALILLPHPLRHVNLHKIIRRVRRLDENQIWNAVAVEVH